MAVTLQDRTRTSIQKKKAPNSTGIPTPVKENFEAVHKLSLDDVQIHYNSHAPAQLQALAYTQYPHVYIAPGQEKHLFHELGHIVQQKKHSIPATATVNGQRINDNPRLEADADHIAMQAASHSLPVQEASAAVPTSRPAGSAIQRMGEKKAVKSVMRKLGKRRSIRRGNVIQDVVKTGGRSTQKVNRLRKTLFPALMQVLKKDLEIQFVVFKFLNGDWMPIYAIASGVLAKLAGAGNCGEYADATFSTLAALGHPQYIYTCCFQGKIDGKELDHAFTMTSPTPMHQTKPKRWNNRTITRATIVDAWYNYQIIPLNRFLGGNNPYRAKLTPENIQITAALSPHQAEPLKGIISSIRKHAVRVYRTLHQITPRLGEKDLQKILNSPYMFGDANHPDAEIPEEVHDSRITRCMNHLNIATPEELQTYFNRLPKEELLEHVKRYQLEDYLKFQLK